MAWYNDAIDWTVGRGPEDLTRGAAEGSGDVAEGISDTAAGAYGAVEGAVSGIPDMFGDTFSQERMQPYIPERGAFDYGDPGRADRLARMYSGQGQRGAAAGQQARQDMLAAGASGQRGAYGQADQFGYDADRMAVRGDQAQQRQIENSRALAQLQQGLDRGMSQNLALARSGRGMGTNAQAMRQAAMQNAAMAQQTNQAAGLVRAEEEARQRAMNDAMTQFYFGQGQGYDQLGESARGRGDQYRLGMTGAGNQYALGTGQLGLGFQQLGQGVLDTQLAAGIDYEKLKSQNITDANRINVEGDAARDAAEAGMIGTLGGGLMGMISDERSKMRIQPLSLFEEEDPMLDPYSTERWRNDWREGVTSDRRAKQNVRYASDERAKTDVREVDDIDAALDRLMQTKERELEPLRSGPPTRTFPDLEEESAGPRRTRVGDNFRRAFDTEGGRQALDMARNAPGYSYEYTDEARERNPDLTAPGRQVGVMAQDLERTPAGRRIVSTGPDGMKAVDTRQAAMASVAGLGELARREDDIDARLSELEKQLRADEDLGRDLDELDRTKRREMERLRRY